MDEYSYINQAVEQYTSDDVQIEVDDPKVSYSGPDAPDAETCRGAWVAAWVFVANPNYKGP